MPMNNQELEAAMAEALRNLDIDQFEELAAEADRRLLDTQRRLSEPGALLAGALWYAAQGLPVFPCRPGDKRPMVRWRDAATTDTAQIQAWWKSTPAANIGLPTGGRYDVIDIDGPEGYRSMAQLKTERRWPAEYLGRALTPSGGMHIYITATEHKEGNHARWRPGIDYRGLGGYVLAPPSRKADGTRWEWCNPLSSTPYRTVYEWEPNSV